MPLKAVPCEAVSFRANVRKRRKHLLWPKHGDMLRGSISPCSPAPLGDGWTSNPLLDIWIANYFLADTHALMIAK
jgi:hypothetical protein